MFLLLIESFLSRGSNEISMTVALGPISFLAEIPDSFIPLTSSMGDYGQDCLFRKE